MCFLGSTSMSSLTPSLFTPNIYIKRSSIDPGNQMSPMELQSHVSTNKLLNYLRLAFLMLRRSFASKRKLLMDMNLLMERIKSFGLVFKSPPPPPPFGGRRSLEDEFSCSNSPDPVFYRAAASKRKLLMDMNLLMERIKSLGLVFKPPPPPPPPFGGRRSLDYEFSCSNSPDPVFYRAAASKRRNAFFFPCLHPVVVDDVPPARIEFSPVGGLQCAASQLLGALGQEEWRRRSPTPSPFSVRASDFSSEDADECSDVAGRAPSRQVDDEAEEFIRRFYEQLRAQSRMALLQYQE